MIIARKAPRYIEAILLIVFGYFCFEYKPFEHRLFHALSKIIPSDRLTPLPFDLSIFLSDLVVFSLALYCIIALKESILNREKKWLFIVLFLTLSSLIFTPYPKQLHGFIRFSQLCFAFFFFYTLAVVLSRENPRQFIQIFLAIIAVIGCIEAGIGLIHYLLQTPIGLSKLGEPKLVANSNLFASIPTLDGSVWIFPFFKTSSSILFRSHGTFPHPNLLGCFLLTSLLSTLYWLLSKNLFIKTVASISCSLQILCLITTFSRSAFFGFLAGGIMLLLLFKFLFKQRIFFISFLVISSILIGGALFFNQIQKRGGLINQSSLSKGSDASRVYYAKIALKMMAAHPFLGIGYDLFSSNIERFVSKESYHPGLKSTVHNIYLLIGSQTGVFSLLSFLIFLSLVIKNGLKTLSFESATLLSIFLCYLLIGFFDYFFLFFQQMKILFFSIAGMLSGYGFYFSKDMHAQKDGCCSILHSLEETEKC